MLKSSKKMWAVAYGKQRFALASFKGVPSLGCAVPAMFYTKMEAKDLMKSRIEEEMKTGWVKEEAMKNYHVVRVKLTVEVIDN
jgi:hypothetical protein